MIEFAWLYWDPSSVFITLPWIDLPLTWYGLFFALSFFIAFHIFVYMFKRFLVFDMACMQDVPDEPSKNVLTKKSMRLFRFVSRSLGEEERGRIKKKLLLEEEFPKKYPSVEKRARDFSDRLILYAIVATVVGARLGHLFFYEKWTDYLLNPLTIIKTWEGGLASHGGITALIFAFWLFCRRIRKEYPKVTLSVLLDYISVPTMFVAFMIRMGNFMNQEIVGVTTRVPWAVIFGHPVDGIAMVPRHPTQLYEAFFYLGVFALLFFIWRRWGQTLKRGRIAGICLVVTFVFRFFIEGLKGEQSALLIGQGGSLLMGQILSIPLVFIGLYALLRKPKVRSVEEEA